MTYRPAKARPKRRKRDDDLDQTRLDFSPYVAPPHDAKSDLDREVQEHVETRREPLPGQAGLPLKEKP